MQSRKTLIFSDREAWVKKDAEDDFNVPIGCHDGAEMCELVVTYLLHQLKVVIAKENMGLYIDNGLRTFKNMSGPEVERKKKELAKIFKNNGLLITVKTNIKTADFLEIHFDLVKEIYQPYRKPNDDPLNINIKSNHPPSILQQLPKSISKRISEISSNQHIFNQSIPYYENGLRKSGYNVSLKYTPTQNEDENNQQREQRKRKIIWFNPPYSLKVKTNVGKLFLKLLDRHFPRPHKFYKLFNRNTVKISYCSVKNMGSIISSHKKQVLQLRNKIYGCNCRKKKTIPLDNKCLTPNIIYEAKISNNTNDEHKKYLGAAETSFKEI